MGAAISAHGLSESYAVLTSTPFVPRVYPAEAWNLLSRNILPYLEVVTLTPEIYRDTIQSCANAGWIGGRIYDALHLRCATQAHCDRIYTFNVRHFRQLAPELSERIGPPSGFP